MKKIFAVSFLSLMAGLVATNVWAENHNLATVDYVQNAIFYANKVDAYQPDVKNGVMVTDKDGDVEVAATISQSNVDGLTTALDGRVTKSQVLTSEFKDLTGKQYDLGTMVDIDTDDMVPTIGLVEAGLDEKVDKTSVVSSTGTVTSDDTQIPTIKRMESAIANAKPDTSGLVDKAAVVVSGGANTMTGATVANNANKDTYVPTVAYAQEMAASAASDAVSGLDAKFQEYVPYATGIGDGFLVTDPTGNVYVNHGVPSSISDAVDEKISVKLDKPVGECAEIGACALVFAGFGENGAPLLQWEKIARSVAEQTAE